MTDPSADATPANSSIQIRPTVLPNPTEPSALPQQLVSVLDAPPDPAQPIQDKFQEQMLYFFQKEGYWGLAMTIYRRASEECRQAPNSYWKFLIQDFKGDRDLYQYLLTLPRTIILPLLRNTITSDIYKDTDVQDFACEHMRTGEAGQANNSYQFRNPTTYPIQNQSGMGVAYNANPAGFGTAGEQQRSTFVSNNITCHNCCQKGHLSRNCNNASAPLEERQAVKGEWERRNAERLQRTQPNLGGQVASGIPSNAEQGRQVPVAAMAEAGPFQREVIDEWKMGSDDMRVNSAYQAECVKFPLSDEECMAIGDKRSAEAEFDDDTPDSAGRQDVSSRPKAKLVRVTEPVAQRITRSAKQNTAPPATAYPPQLSPILQPTTVKAKVTAVKRRAMPTRRKLRGTGESQPWSASEVLKGMDAQISILQLAEIAPRARAMIAEAIRLELNPNTKAGQNFLRKQMQNQMSEMEEEPMEVTKAEAEGRMSALRRGNFYTSAIIQPRRLLNNEFELKKVLIGAGATLNLIPERIATKMGMIRMKDDTMSIRLANGSQVRLLGYTKCFCTVAGVRKVVEAYIVPGDTNYSMILGRPWLRAVQAIGVYAKDEYWLKDEFGEIYQIEEVIPTNEVQSPEVMIGQQASRDLRNLSAEVLTDLELSRDERLDQILQEIIAQADEEDEEEEDITDEEYEEFESGNGLFSERA